MVSKRNKKRQKLSLSELREEHSSILRELSHFEKSFVRIGGKLDDVERFLALFDNKVSHIIKLEESTIFPYLEKHIEEDGPLYVMRYTHDIIRTEFEKLRNALLNKDISSLHKSAKRLADVLRFHITKEDEIVLREFEKTVGSDQILQFD